MNATSFVILAYAIGLGLPWGYAAYLWLSSRNLSRREAQVEGAES